jgi:hypothetical protein
MNETNKTVKIGTEIEINVPGCGTHKAVVISTNGVDNSNVRVKMWSPFRRGATMRANVVEVNGKWELA